VKEQRRYSRKRLRVRGCYQDRDGKVFKGIVQNISLGGVYIETPWPLDRGENINLSIDAGDVGKVIGVEGRVVRSMPEKGMGIEFTDQNNEDIKKFIRTMRNLEQASMLALSRITSKK
jgi:hypothetical protein